MAITNVAQTLSSKPPRRLGAGPTRLAWVLGGASGAAALLAGPAYRLHWLPLGTGLQTMRWAAIVALVGAAAALLGLVLLWRSGARRGVGAAAAALLLNGLVAGPPLAMYQRVQSLPHIHDVSTDPTDPPAFVAVVPLRQGARNGLDYPPATAAAQRRGYSDIAPLVIALQPPQAFERVEQAARAMGWDIVADSPQDLRLEATDTSLLFGFKDDVVVRVRPHARGSVVDVRSLSRVGGSDFGVNAKRVRAFLQRLAPA